MKKLAGFIAFSFIAAISFFSFKPQNISIKEANFKSGEKLTYKIFYNWNFVWLSAGEMVFEVKDEGNEYHIEGTGYTYTSYEWFYKVRDKYHSYINKETLLPRLYVRDIHQGSYVHYEKIVFDQVNGKARSYTGKNMSSLEMKEVSFQGAMYDLISVMYFLRNADIDKFKRDKLLPFNMLLDHQQYKLGLRYKNEQSRFNVKEVGKFNVMSCIASAVSGHVFKEDAEMKLYIGNDKNNIPLMIESPLSVGSVKAVLKSQENLKYPLSSKL